MKKRNRNRGNQSPVDSRLVARLASFVADGEPTPFRFEGIAVAALRARWCLAGWPFDKADTVARETMAAVYRRIQLRRPTWSEGQRDYALSPVDACRACGGPLGIASLAARHGFCCDLCMIRHHSNRDSSEVRWQSRTAHAVGYLIRREAIPERECAGCGEVFQPSHYFVMSCSPECAHEARRKRAPWRACPTCGTGFRPSQPRQTYCSAHCQWTASAARKPRSPPPPPRRCEGCGQMFVPKRADSLTCSAKCSTDRGNRLAIARRQAARDPIVRRCAECDSEFEAARPHATYCGHACQSRAFRRRQREAGLECAPGSGKSS